MNPPTVGLSVESYEQLWPRTDGLSDPDLDRLWDGQRDLARQATDERRDQGIMVPEGALTMPDWLDLLLAAVVQWARCKKWRDVPDYRGEQDGSFHREVQVGGGGPVAPGY